MGAHTALGISSCWARLEPILPTPMCDVAKRHAERAHTTHGDRPRTATTHLELKGSGGHSSQGQLGGTWTDSLSVRAPLTDGSHSITNTSVHSCLSAVLTVALPRRETCQKTRGIDAQHASFSLSHRWPLLRRGRRHHGPAMEPCSDAVPPTRGDASRRIECGAH